MLRPDLCGWLVDDGVRSQSEARDILGMSHQWMRASDIIEGADNFLRPMCTACDGGHRVDRPRIKDGKWEGYCPEAGWFCLEEDDVLAVRISRQKFTRRLGQSLETDRTIPFDRFAYAADSQGMLLDIGNAPIAKAYRHVLVSYFPGTAIGFNKLAVALKSTRHIRQALILSVAPTVYMADLPFGHQLAWLGDVCALGKDGFELDQAALSAWVEGVKIVSRADDVQRSSWQEDAIHIWWSLHEGGNLNKNAAKMGRQVRTLLTARRSTSGDVPEPKHISDALRSLHRKHYPKS